MPEAEPIRYWDRARRQVETEQVYGGALVNWLYGSQAGRSLADHVLTRPLLSRFYGAYQSSPLSRHKILPFIRAFGIAMEEYEDPGYSSFNDFFIRKFRPGARRFAAGATAFPAPCEARYLAFQSVKPDQLFPVKGTLLSPSLLIGRDHEELAKPFRDGPLLIARLCPTDYHRFHYPDEGKTLEHFRVPGVLHSVNPAALRYRGDIFAVNERRVSILETRNFGRLAYIEVGALCVGLIVQTHPETTGFQRGDEKGYFLFGASTVIILGERGAWTPDGDLLEQSARRIETFVRLGENIAGN